MVPAVLNFVIDLKETSAFLVALTVKNLPAVLETQVRFQGQEDPLETGMATHLSILAWKRGAWWAVVPGVTRVGHDLVTKPPPPEDL